MLVLDRLGSGAADALELLDMVVEEGDEVGFVFRSELPVNSRRAMAPFVLHAWRVKRSLDREVTSGSPRSSASHCRISDSVRSLRPIAASAAASSSSANWRPRRPASQAAP